MDIRFQDKRALVTGAGKGIGRAIAKGMSGGGATTYALSRTQSDLDSLKEECPTIRTVCVDLADWDATKKAVQDIGPIDLLVNNAGVAYPISFLETTHRDLDKTLSVNLKAVFTVSQVVAKKGMIERGDGGAIVNVSTIISTLAYPSYSAYCASKGALDQLTRVMALELGHHQIRVNAVNPSTVLDLTEMSKKAAESPEVKDVFSSMTDATPMGKLIETSDVVRAVLYLLSDKSDMINGVTLRIDGGASVKGGLHATANSDN